MCPVASSVRKSLVNCASQKGSLENPSRVVNAVLYLSCSSLSIYQYPLAIFRVESYVAPLNPYNESYMRGSDMSSSPFSNPQSIQKHNPCGKKGPCSYQLRRSTESLTLKGSFKGEATVNSRGKSYFASSPK